jgi:iron complex transport system substrate-binding protein
MRICSFLPSATEILYALDLGDSIAGITYECDFPEAARLKPVVVNTRLSPSTDAADIDRQVRQFMARQESLYRIETGLLREIQPDLIVTQDLCHVCAASPGDLGSALATLDRKPQVLSLNPTALEGVWNDVLSIGKATGRVAQAERVVAGLRQRVAAVEKQVAGLHRPRVVCLEWLDPPFIAGHWVPEMVALAGGADVIGKAGRPSSREEWRNIFDAKPDVIVIMPCGYHLQQAVEEFTRFHFPPSWTELPAVAARRVFVVDATSYFSRPGPRLADGVEILAHLFHPERVPRPAATDAMALIS